MHKAEIEGWIRKVIKDRLRNSQDDDPDLNFHEGTGKIYDEVSGYTGIVEVRELE